jgi:hypothetical protein
MVVDVPGAPTVEGNVATLEQLLGFPPAVSVIGTTGVSVTMTAMGALAGVAIGDVVTGLGIVTSPPTTVVALDDGAHTVTLSQAALGIHVGQPYLFTPSPVMPPTTLHLFKDSFSPTARSVEADFLGGECDFSGYAPSLLTFGAAGIDSNGNGLSYADRVEFQNSTGAVGNGVGGAWISQVIEEGGSPVTSSIRYYKFVSPIPMNIALQTMGAVVVLNTPNLSAKCIIDN